MTPKEIDVAMTRTIAAAARKEKSGQAAGVIGKAIEDGLRNVREQCLAGAPRGDKIGVRLSKGVDIAVRALFDAVGDAGAAIAICAVGGYGRNQMAPFSDIDLLILYTEKSESDAKSLLNRFLYPLWDAKAKIGHAVHTPQSAVQFAKNDLVGRTSYLDARIVCGDAALFDDFQKRFQRLQRTTKTEFVKAKLAEQDERQRKSNETRYLTEPDIKDGKGALRDLQTIRWIYKYVYGGDAQDNASPFSESDERDLAKAERFFWSVRAYLHQFRGRADERLSFDIQQQVAERLGYADRDDETAAERLMRHYFVTAVDVGRLTRILCARLEAERTKRAPRLPRSLPAVLEKDEAPGKPNIRLHNGRLDFRSAAKARSHPRDFFRLFRAFSKRPDFDFHPDALALISDELASVTSDVRKDAAVASLFRAILAESSAPERTLRIMAEAGLLGKYIRAFGEIVGRIEFGLYRQLTIDEHVLRSIGLLREIHDGRHKREHPLTTRALSSAQNPPAIYMAVLLHQSMWSQRVDGVESCERLIRRIAIRLEYDETDADRIAWAGARHALMTDMAERRDIHDPELIEKFAEEVGDLEKLNILTALAVCYQRTVSDSAWGEYIRRQLTELYWAAEAWIKGGRAAFEKRAAKRIKDARLEIAGRLTDWSDKERDAFLEIFDQSALNAMEPHLVSRFAELMRAARREELTAAVGVTQQRGDLEALIYAKDRQGLLADLAGAAASAGASVRWVTATPLPNGMVLDIFVLRAADGAPIDDAPRISRLHKRLLAAAKARPAAPPELKRRFGDRRPIFNVEPAVRVDCNAAGEAVIIETEGLDRPGLLYDLASALSDLSLTIQSAHIATYGERAVDAFYLTDAEGAAPVAPRRFKEIEKRFLQVLSAGAGD